jgi:hypothetical protein
MKINNYKYFYLFIKSKYLELKYQNENNKNKYLELKYQN